MNSAFFAAPDVELEVRDDARIVRSRRPLEAYPDHLGVHLRRWAAEAPDRLAFAERRGDGWRSVSWGEALVRAEGLGQGLLEAGASADRPVMVLSGNSLDHALLMLGAHLAGVPIAPVSPAYSLLSQDHGKLKHVFSKVRPALVYVEAPEPFRAALGALDLRDTTLVIGSGSDPVAGDPDLGRDVDAGRCLRFSELERSPDGRLAAAEAAVGPETVAKMLFTSGSTGVPKGVLNTHRMLCSNQQMIAQVWPGLRDAPPELLDWLPWNHTFGGNHNFNMVLAHGGSLYIDGGKPAPGLVEVTVENVRLLSPTLYFNVPAGFAQLLPFLESESELCGRFFARLQMIFYAGAALPQDLWRRLERLSLDVRGEKVAMTSAWGSTETSPASTTVHFPIERAGVIGLPLPGVEVKLVPSGSKHELRVRGPHVFERYLGEEALTQEAFDAEGFYRIGDAGQLVDASRPELGLRFDGRVAEDFKLLTGTWVHAGQLRVEALAAAQPVLQDAVVAGHDRAEVSLLAWPNLAACRVLVGAGDEVPTSEILAAPAVRERVVDGLRQHNAEAGGSSRRIARVLLMEEPASSDAGEITDKGYVNPAATLERRSELVEKLYRDPPPPEVWVI
ncbi:MAG: feruloyl-CoA synthase [Acidobacteriota bacterium]